MYVYTAKFYWAETVDALDKNDESKVSSLLQQLLDALMPYIIMPPPEDDSSPCQAPVFSSEVNCSQYPSAFTGVPREVSLVADRYTFVGLT